MWSYFRLFSPSSLRSHGSVFQGRCDRYSESVEHRNYHCLIPYAPPHPLAHPLTICRPVLLQVLCTAEQYHMAWELVRMQDLRPLPDLRDPRWLVCTPLPEKGSPVERPFILQLCLPSAGQLSVAPKTAWS